MGGLDGVGWVGLGGGGVGLGGVGWEGWGGGWGGVGQSVGNLLSIGLSGTKEVHFGHMLSLQQPHLHHTLRSQNVFSFLQPTQQKLVRPSNE